MNTSACSTRPWPIICWTPPPIPSASIRRSRTAPWPRRSPSWPRPGRTTRLTVAHWTGETGEAREAWRLSTELLPDLERVLGRDHPTTLATRNNIAHWTGEVGDWREALRLSTALLPDRERVLGHDHPDTLTTRSNIAAWTGEMGD